MGKKKTILDGGIEKGSFHLMSHGWIEIVEIISDRDVRIRFLEHPCEISVRSGQIRLKAVKNPMKPSVCGVGFPGIGIYDSKSVARQVWGNMMLRVYNPPNERTAREYKETSVHAHWHNFQNFAVWYHQQIDHFGPVGFRWNLDKDIMIAGNRIYGPESCCVVPEAVNRLFNDTRFIRGKLPIGVQQNEFGYKATCSSKLSDNSGYVGFFKNIQEASSAYWCAKIKAIQHTAIMYWAYLPQQIAMRLVSFDMNDAVAYFGDEA